MSQFQENAWVEGLASGQKDEQKDRWKDGQTYPIF